MNLGKIPKFTGLKIQEIYRKVSDPIVTLAETEGVVRHFDIHLP